jgi:HlyD family secretion protein
MNLHMNRRRAIIGGAVLLLMVIIVLARRDPGTDVDVGTADWAPLTVEIEQDGRTRATDRYIVTAPVSGQLERIQAREGAPIESGSVVARIEPLPLDAPTVAGLQASLSAAQARREGAGASIVQARAARDQAVHELERRRTLAEDGVLTAEQMEQYELAARTREQQYRAAEQTLRAAEADVAAARATLAGSTPDGAARSAVAVRAPASGVLLRVPERSGRLVTAGTPLVEIGDPHALEVVADVLTRDAVRIRPGMPAVLRNWGGPDLHATVRTIEPSAFTRISALGVEEQRVNVLLDLADRPPELGDGYRVDAAITVWSTPRTLTVPSSALFRAGAGWAVFVVEDGRARLRSVGVGERSGARVQVLEGLEAGQPVVLFPSDELEDGVRVRRRE